MVNGGGTEGRKDGRTDGRMEIPPCVLQDIGPLGSLPKKVWQDLQIGIGAEKIFPSISYSNLDQETTIVILQ